MMVLSLHNLGKVAPCRKLQEPVTDTLKNLSPLPFPATKPVFGNFSRKAHQGKALVKGKEEKEKVLLAEVVREGSTKKLLLRSVHGNEGCASLQG